MKWRQGNLPSRRAFFWACSWRVVSFISIPFAAQAGADTGINPDDAAWRSEWQRAVAVERNLSGQAQTQGVAAVQEELRTLQAKISAGMNAAASPSSKAVAVARYVNDLTLRQPLPEPLAKAQTEVGDLARDCHSALTPIADQRYVATLAAGESVWLRLDQSFVGKNPIRVTTVGSDIDPTISSYRGECESLSKLKTADDEIGLAAVAMIDLGDDGQPRWVEIQNRGSRGQLVFGLDNAAIIRGRVVLPLGFESTSVEVSAYSSATNQLEASQPLMFGGVYELPVRAGQYHVRTSNASSYVLDEVFDNAPCYPATSSAPAVSCDIAAATVIILAAEEIRENVNFALERGSLIAGSVRLAQSQLPSRTVTLFNAARQPIATTVVPGFSFGEYQFFRLRPGDYYVAAIASGYRPQAYDRVECLLGNGIQGCPLENASRITISPTISADRIDFNLSIIPFFIHGTIVYNGPINPGEPTEVTVRFLNRNGTFLSTVATIGESGEGTYRSDALPAGVYYVYATGRNIVSQIHPDVLCASGCANFEDMGSPIVLSTQSSVQVDLSLRKRPIVYGKVTDAATGIALTDVRVEAHRQNSAATSETTTLVDAQGEYKLAVDIGTHTLFTVADRHLDLAYPGAPCESAAIIDCSRSVAPYSFSSDGMTNRRVDFALPKNGEVSGRVNYRPTSDYLVQAGSRVLRVGNDSNNAYLANAAGNYQLIDMPPGAHVLVGQINSAYQRYPDRDCSYSSTTIAACIAPGPPSFFLQQGEILSNINFGVFPVDSIYGSVVDARTNAPIAGVIVDSLYSGYPGFGETVVTDAQGRYVYTPRYPLSMANSYLVGTNTGGVFFDQVHRRVDCGIGTISNNTCPTANATMIRFPQTTVAPDQATNRADFRLLRRSDNRIFNNGFDTP